MSLSTYIAKRLLQGLLVIFLCTLIVFLVTEFSPGSVARKILGQFATAEQVAMLNEQLGVSRPAVERYFSWLGQIVGLSPGVGRTPESVTQGFGNFGYSLLYREQVTAVLGDRLQASAMLAALAMAIIIPVATILGVICAVRENSIVDNVLSTICVVSTSLPQFAWGAVLVVIFVLVLKVLPGTSPMETVASWSIPQQLVLPVLTLVLVEVGYIAKIVRSSMISVLERPYIRTARLKGACEFSVVFRHALPNAMITPFTIIMLQVGYLVSGVVVTEVVFAYPGFGRMLLEAALFGDIALIQGATICAVVITVASQLIADIGYVFLNPRIEFK